MGLLTAFIVPECNFTNLAGPRNSEGIHPRGAKSMRMITLLFFKVAQKYT